MTAAKRQEIADVVTAFGHLNGLLQVAYDLAVKVDDERDASAAHKLRCLVAAAGDMTYVMHTQWSDELMSRHAAETTNTPKEA